MEHAYLGIDVGSISTKGVIIDKQNNILSSQYIWTQGDPIGAVKKLVGLLTQNLRKGNRGLGELLETEMWQAFENRKALARKQGEEAGTKLLLPMIGMLGVVMVIVIAPALMSMQM